jgi:uncharacterized membrane protein
VTLLICLVGIGLRWVNLSGKVFWHDEVFTALRVTGHIGKSVEKSLFTGSPFTAQTLQQYQTFAPGSTLADTWRSLLDHPEHPPLYFLLTWIWVKLWGTSIFAFRSISALFSVLTMPLIGCLAWELFRDRLAVILAILLFAVSPVQVLYAQEARGYSLWVGLIILASAAFLWFLRTRTRSAWILYTLAIALSLYTSLFSALIIAAHAVYVGLAVPRWRWRSILAAQGVAMLLFSPWISVIIYQAERFQAVTGWAFQLFPRGLLVKLWGLHFSSAFIDPNLPPSHPYTYWMPPLVIMGLVISIIGCWRRISRQVGFWLATSIVIPCLVLMGGDLVRNSYLSAETRYFLPMLAIAQIAIAGWLSSYNLLRQRWVLSLVCLLLTVGIVNSTVMTMAPTWWNKKSDYFNHQNAAEISAFSQPLVLTQCESTTLGSLISLSYYLSPQTRFQVTYPPTPPKVAIDSMNPGDSILLYRPLPSLQQAYDCPATQLSEVLYQLQCN